MGVCSSKKKNDQQTSESSQKKELKPSEAEIIKT